VYALLFADAGLSTGQISTLFVIWSVVAFAFEVPSGALADAWSRRGLYAIGEVLTAVGYALWLIWPTFPGFALGFVLWGLGGALSSGTLEALVYDELAAEGRSADYAKITGRGGTVAILAMLAATLLATPAFAVGGYRLVGIASVATVTLGGLLALSLPQSRSRTDAEGDDHTEASYVSLLRAGLRESTSSRRVLRAVAIAALLPGFSALDEYLPLLARDRGAPTAGVPLLFGLTALAMAAGSALAGRFESDAQFDGRVESDAQFDGRNPIDCPGQPRTGRAWRPRPLPTAVTAAAILLAGGALIPHISGMVAVSAAFGLLQFAMIRAETNLQDQITGPARTTVLSVSGFAAEVFAVVLYAWFALDLALPVLFALCAVPLLLTAAAAATPAARRHAA
jgi:MFS family permease